MNFFDDLCYKCREQRSNGGYKILKEENMEDLVEKVNEKFLNAILNMQEVISLGALASAYLDFTHAAATMQGMKLDLDNWLCEDECCQF